MKISSSHYSSQKIKKCITKLAPSVAINLENEDCSLINLKYSPFQELELKSITNPEKYLADQRCSSTGHLYNIKNCQDYNRSNSTKSLEKIKSKPFKEIRNTSSDLNLNFTKNEASINFDLENGISGLIGGLDHSNYDTLISSNLKSKREISLRNSKKACEKIKKIAIFDLNKIKPANEISKPINGNNISSSTNKTIPLNNNDEANISSNSITKCQVCISLGPNMCYNCHMKTDVSIMKSKRPEDKIMKNQNYKNLENDSSKLMRKRIDQDKTTITYNLNLSNIPEKKEKAENLLNKSNYETISEQNNPKKKYQGLIEKLYENAQKRSQREVNSSFKLTL